MVGRDDVARATELRADDLLALGRGSPRGPVPLRIADRPGTVPTRPRGQGHEIREVRAFVAGDDPRHLDAAATARSGQLQVRSFHEDRDRTLFLIADFRRPMLWGSRRFRSVCGAEALARAGWQAVSAGGSVGVAAITDSGLDSARVSPRTTGMARVIGCLVRAHAGALAQAARPPRPLAPELARAARLVPRGATVLLASSFDEPGEHLDDRIGALLRRGPVTCLIARDPVETSPPRRLLSWFDAAGHRRQGTLRDLSERHHALAGRLRALGAGVEVLEQAEGPDIAAEPAA